MNLNFEVILFYAVLVTGLVVLFDVLFLAKKRNRAYIGAEGPKLPLIIDYARAFFPILFVVFFIRSFFYEPFRIPSGSLEPTLFAGDFILVNKFHYGVRLPVGHEKIYSMKEPKRGDIIVFRWPPDPSLDFIKRIVAVPGDHLRYANKILYVNGQEMPQVFVKNTTTYDEAGHELAVVQKEENLSGTKHAIFQLDNRPMDDLIEIVVPEGMYFAMGDNRDLSADSRFWGFVPEENIIGQASRIWMSWDSLKHTVRWGRLGKKIN